MIPQIYEFDYDELNDILYIGLVEHAKDNSYGEELSPDIVAFREVDTKKIQGLLIFAAILRKGYHERMLLQYGFKIDLGQYFERINE